MGLNDIIVYVDGADYTATYALAGAEPIACRLRTGIVDTEHGLTMRWVQPRVKAHGADFDFVLAVDRKRRNGDPDEFIETGKVGFSTRTTADHVSMGGGSGNQMQFELVTQTRLDAPKAWFEIKEIPMRAVVKNAS